MQKNQELEQEYAFLKALATLEELAEKKTKIYSRLLTDVDLAKEMEVLSIRHQNRKNTLLSLMGEKPKKFQKEGGVYAMNEEDEQE
jgi:hypothetical protein